MDGGANMRRTEQEYCKDEVARALKVVGWIKDYEIDLHPDLPPRSVIVKLFETTKLDDVWREVGVVVPGKRRRYTKEEVAEALKKVGWLTVKEINRHPDLPTETTIFKLFKTTKINDVWQELNIPFAPRPSYTKEVVAEALKETGWIKNEDIQSRPELPSLTAIINLFNTESNLDISWFIFIDKSGFIKSYFVKSDQCWVSDI